MPRHSLYRRIRRRVRPYFVQPLLWLVQTFVPYLYVAYLWLVWKTSHVEDCGYPSLPPEIIERHDGLIAMLWHEEVFSVAWSYRAMHPHTLTNVSDSGELITRILEVCGYVVFRGGSSRRKSRQREYVLIEMVRHMRENRRVVYGVTVDGSYGPYHVVKPGALFIARKCGKPIVLVRTWAKRNLRLPTWDGMAVPLPFNRIRQYLVGPYFVPEDAEDPKRLETFGRELEGKLVELAAASTVWPR